MARPLNPQGKCTLVPENWLGASGQALDFDLPNPKRSARLGLIFLCQSVMSIRSPISALSIIHPALKRLPPPHFLPFPGFSLSLLWNSDYSCPQLGGQGGTKLIYHFSLPPATDVSLESLPHTTSRVPVREDVLGGPALHTVGHQEGGKREWETEKETKRSLDFVRLESQKTHKTKSMTFT